MLYYFTITSMFEQKDVCCPMLFTKDWEECNGLFSFYYNAEVMFHLRYEYNAVMYDTNMLFLVLGCIWACDSYFDNYIQLYILSILIVTLILISYFNCINCIHVSERVS